MLIFSLAALGQYPYRLRRPVIAGLGCVHGRGAFGAYNFMLRIDGMPFLLALVMGGCARLAVGVLFGLPSLRIKGFYLAVATLAAQFFIVWALVKVSVVLELLVIGRDLDPRRSASWASSSMARPRNTCSPWRWWWCLRWLPRTWCAAVPDAHGWRFATWTWPPR